MLLVSGVGSIPLPAGTYELFITAGPEREAVTHGISSKGPWVLSKTEAMHIALPIDYLRKEGLVNLEELWNKFAPKWRTA